MRKELSGIYFTPSFNLFRVYLEYMHANRNVYVYVQFLFFALFIFPLERKENIHPVLPVNCRSIHLFPDAPRKGLHYLW